MQNGSVRFATTPPISKFENHIPIPPLTGLKAIGLKSNTYILTYTYVYLNPLDLSILMEVWGLKHSSSFFCLARLEIFS